MRSVCQEIGRRRAGRPGADPAERRRRRIVATANPCRPDREFGESQNDERRDPCADSERQVSSADAARDAMLMMSVCRRLLAVVRGAVAELVGDRYDGAGNGVRGHKSPIRRSDEGQHMQKEQTRHCAGDEIATSFLRSRRNVSHGCGVTTLKSDVSKMRERRPQINNVKMARTNIAALLRGQHTRPPGRRRHSFFSAERAAAAACVDRRYSRTGRGS